MWTVLMEPVERGVLVHVTDGNVKSTIGRVAFSRRGTKRPFWRTFGWSLRRVIERAEAEATRLNA